MRATARNAPQLVVDALREFGNMPEISICGDPDTLALQQEIDSLNQVIETMKDQLRDNQDTPPATNQGHKKLDELAWKIAAGVINGTINGITFDDICTLRDAA